MGSGLVLFVKPDPSDLKHTFPPLASAVEKQYFKPVASRGVLHSTSHYLRYCEPTPCTLGEIGFEANLFLTICHTSGENKNRMQKLTSLDARVFFVRLRSHQRSRSLRKKPRL